MMQKKTISISTLIAVGLALLFSACTSTDHQVIVNSPNIEKPVSASGYYISEDGRVVSPSEYKIVDHVSFLKEDEAPVDAVTSNEMSIEAELEEIFANYDADALVNFKAYAEMYDSGNTAWVGFTRIFGSVSLIMGAPFLIWGLAEDDEFLIPFGASFSLIGGVNLGLSFILPGMSKSVWALGFEGDAVQQIE